MREPASSLTGAGSRHFLSFHLLIYMKSAVFSAHLPQYWEIFMQKSPI